MRQSTLRSIWESNAGVFRNEPAVVFGDKRQTFADLHDRALRIGSALHKLGMRTQDRVSMLAMNSEHFIEFYNACECTGFIASTINFRLAAPEVQYILNDATPKVLIFESQYTALVESIRDALSSVAHYVCIDYGSKGPDWATPFEEFVASGDPDGAPCRPRPEDIAYLIYTSGTTGKPKGCMLGHAEQLAQSSYMAEMLHNSASSRTLLVMPFYHIGAKALQLGQHRVGGTVFVHRNFDAEAMFKTIEAERVTHLHLAPVMVQSMIEHPDAARYDLSSVNCICYSAAPMPEPVLRRGLELLGPVFVQLWGMTEGCGTVLPAAFHRLDGDEQDQRRLVSIGYVFPESEVRIVDDDDQDVPTGIAGEMLIRGPAITRGYWNNSAATVEALRGGWLHTGDVCKQDEDGLLYLVDRKKDMIISGGENIYSREVEETVLKLSEIAECAVIGVPHERWGEAVCAVVVKRPGSTLSEQDIVTHCRNQIAGYKRPRFVVFADDELPKLPSGKITKVELRKRYAAPGTLTEIN